MGLNGIGESHVNFPTNVTSLYSIPLWFYHIYYVLIVLSGVIPLRDRPFNLKGGEGYGFLFRSEFFFRATQELEFYFFCRARREFFFQNLSLGYMTKTLNQIFFFLHQNQNNLLNLSLHIRFISLICFL